MGSGLTISTILTKKRNLMRLIPRLELVRKTLHQIAEADGNGKIILSEMFTGKEESRALSELIGVHYRVGPLCS